MDIPEVKEGQWRFRQLFVNGVRCLRYGGGHWGRDICVFDRNLYWNAAAKPVLLADQQFSAWQATGQDKNIQSRNLDSLAQYSRFLVMPG